MKFRYQCWLLLLLALPLFVFSQPAWAQFSSLKTTPDGLTLYFVSTLRQNGTTQPLHGKVFALGDREMRPVRIIDPVPVSEQWSNYYDIAEPYLNFRGLFFGVRAYRKCYINFFQACKAFEGSTWGNAEFQGSLLLSPNRRIALQAVWGGLSDFHFTLRDLNFNLELARATSVNGLHIVTDEGTVWRHAGSGIERLVAGATQFETVIPQEEVRFFQGLANIPFTSQVLTWQPLGNDRSQLWRIDTSTKVWTQVGPEVPLSCSTITTAVRQALIAGCSKGQGVELLRLDAAAAEWRPLASEIREWTLSGDGNIIWYLTRANAFHKVNLLTETDENRLPPVGGLELQQSGTAPGSLLYVNGFGICEADVYLKRGAEASALTPISRSDSQLIYRMPQSFPYPLEDYSFEFRSSAPSLFEFRIPFNSGLRPVDPLFFTADPITGVKRPTTFAANAVAATADFSSLITKDNPARPGQIIHLWALNLGPYENGRLSTPNFSCDGPGQPSLPVLYAGPAPGLDGVHQITLRMPDSFPEQNSMYVLSCGFRGTFPLRANAQIPVLP